MTNRCNSGQQRGGHLGSGVAHDNQRRALRSLRHMDNPEFFEPQDLDFYCVDDASLTGAATAPSTPEPRSWILCLLGLFSLGTLHYRQSAGCETAAGVKLPGS